ncbi:hypothetical protein IFR04_004294 [Cadophora malorum]|uniref:Uncharacterized protein n=1 Tax=Cadophora malorum TaxID=108018 RepID=A0A8H8BSA1_9HELO|nr:hypothetical protein IFR04_004294 [Cadophora malorum]
MRYSEILTAAGFFAASASAAAIAISNAANIAFATPLTALNSRSASEPVVVIGQPAPLLLITCADPKFLGECETWPGAELKCYNFPDYFQNRITSVDTRIGLMDGVQTCTLYSELGCGGKSHAFTDAKVDDLRPFGMDDVAKSYMCEEEWFEPPSGER